MNISAETDSDRNSPVNTPATRKLESQFLLLCGRCNISENGRELEALLQERLNWDVIYTAAAHHGLLPLVHWNLACCPEGSVPPHVQAEFQSEFEKNAARSFYLTATLHEVHRHLHNCRVLAAAYKGPALARVAYDNLLLRPYCDLDILLPRIAMEPLRTALEELGFHKKFHSYAESNEYAHKFTRESEEGWVVIEAHWAITPRHFALPPGFDGMWERLIEVELGGEKVAALGATDHLLVLCWHGYKHRWSRLEWVVCIAEMIRRSAAASPSDGHRIDWELLSKIARDTGSKRILLTGVRLAHDLFQAPVPQSLVAQSRKDQVLARMLPPLQRELFRLTEHEPGRTAQPRFFHLQSRERWRDKIAYLWKLMVTPGQIDWRMWRPRMERSQQK